MLCSSQQGEQIFIFSLSDSAWAAYNGLSATIDFEELTVENLARPCRESSVTLIGRGVEEPLMPEWVL